MRPIVAAALFLGAATGLAQPSPAKSEVVFIPAAKVAAAFAKGMPLVETGAYKIHASHRDGPGMAEVHALDTDIIYVLEGTATLVTGGAVVDGKTVADNETRGAGIAGGEPQPLRPGDVIVVPHGVPHWFKAASAPFNYFVVKVH